LRLSLPLAQAVASEERAQRVSRARTLRAEDYRLARAAAAVASQQAADAAIDAAAVRRHRDPTLQPFH